MLTTLIALAAMFSIILITHNYVLEAMHNAMLSEPKPHTDITD